jgi:hypothetical protein
MLQRQTPSKPDIIKSSVKRGEKNPLLPVSYRRECQHHADIYRYAVRRSSQKNLRPIDRPKCNPIKTSHSVEGVICMTNVKDIKFLKIRQDDFRIFSDFFEKIYKKTKNLFTQFNHLNKSHKNQ